MFEQMQRALRINRLEGYSIRALKIGYIFALGSIAILTIFTWAIVHTVIDAQATSAAVVNVSGRQRMLSQEISFLAEQLVLPQEAGERKITRGKLTVALEQMEKNQKGLLQGDSTMHLPTQMSPVLVQIYYQEPLKLADQVNRFISESQSLLQAKDSELNQDNPQLVYILKVRESLRTVLDETVNQYQLESEQKIERLQDLEKSALGVTLVVLTIEALFIFRPLINLVQKKQQNLESVNLELKYLSDLDGLTGIANRRSFDDALRGAWAEAKLSGKPLALIMCDIDYFKAYNDTYGHQQGDECLRQIAKTLQATLNRKGDFVARYGGEEFVVILPNTDLAGAITVAEGLRDGVLALQLKHEQSLVLPYVTISLGVAAQQDAFSMKNSTNLVETADQALYLAKREGRNRVRSVD